MKTFLFLMMACAGAAFAQPYGPPSTPPGQADKQTCCPAGATCDWGVKVTARVTDGAGGTWATITHEQAGLWPPVAQAIYQAGINAINEQGFAGYVESLNACLSEEEVEKVRSIGNVLMR